ncbi:hypothetical protein COY95_00795 [Candidatus Woesearchaeota archaeon CG_4_10_14_0_8_um_filter_47_5]|nr:MAG: hypothetical protein COY95_00795 [Candidatus Woesearchaeota archaeon CG_4_10_14_0_8_um_filter_47_5]
MFKYVMRRNRRGYFFVLDAFLAIMIIAATLIVLLSGEQREPTKSRVPYISQDILNYLTRTQVNELNNNWVFGLYTGGNENITNPTNSLIQQIGEFYVTGRRSLAENFTRNVTLEVIPLKFGAEFILFNETNRYNLTLAAGERDQTNASFFISHRTVVSGIINSSSSWGPLIGEVRVWQ